MNRFARSVISLKPVHAIRDEYARAYSGLPRRAWILFAVNLVNSSGAMVIFFLSLYLTRQMGLPPARAGLALSLYGVGSLGGAYAGGWLADRVGSIRVQKISLAVCGVMLVVLGQVRALAGILPLLFGFALFAGMLYPANATSMSRICPPELQVKGFALNRLANNLGATIGPAIGGVLALMDYRLLFWADGLTCLAAAVLFMLLWPGSGLAGAEDVAGAGEKSRRELSGVKAGKQAEPVGDVIAIGKDAPASVRVEAAAASPVTPIYRSPWRDGPFLWLMLILLLWCAVFIQFLTTFPLYIRNVYGLAENRIGQLFAVNTILIVLLEMILMEKIRKYPLARMINVSFVVLGVGLGLLPFGRGFAFGALAVAIATFGEMLSMPLVSALIAGRADDTNRGRYMGLFSFVFSLAFIVGPPAGTAIYDWLGPDAVWYVCAGACAMITVAFSALRPYLERR